MNEHPLIIEIHPTDVIPVASSPGYLTLVAPWPGQQILVNQIVLADWLLYRVVHPPDTAGGHVVLTAVKYPADIFHTALIGLLKEARK